MRGVSLPTKKEVDSYCEAFGADGAVVQVLQALEKKYEGPFLIRAKSEEESSHEESSPKGHNYRQRAHSDPLPGSRDSDSGYPYNNF